MRRLFEPALVLLAFACFVGCNNNQTAEKKSTSGGKSSEVAKAEHKHDGWWCTEHGIPEHDCAQCNAKVAAEYKKKGDWCKEHDRPESQCFICHPELKAKFAAQYRTKYGKEPPPIEEEKKDDTKEPNKKG